jgi:hypothetical protein
VTHRNVFTYSYIYRYQTSYLGSLRQELSQISAHRWGGNIKMDLGEIGWDGMDWIDLAQDRNQWRAPGSIKCWEVLEYLSEWQLLKNDSAPWS